MTIIRKFSSCMANLKRRISGVVRFRHRLEGCKLLNGNGIEIGALHVPAPVPNRCAVEYCDALSKEDASKYFPELNIDSLVDVKYISDLDTQGLSIFEDCKFDFVILNHVIEHVANPIRAVEEIFRITKNNGLVVISAPDKMFTFDRKREITPFKHLLDEYRDGVTEVTDDHYIDFLKAAHPEVLKLSESEINEQVQFVRQRREHAHVWDSSSFKEFLADCFSMLDIDASCIYESLGKDNHFEYFSVWKKSA